MNFKSEASWLFSDRSIARASLFKKKLLEFSGEPHQQHKKDCINNETQHDKANEIVGHAGCDKKDQRDRRKQCGQKHHNEGHNYLKYGMCRAGSLLALIAVIGACFLFFQICHCESPFPVPDHTVHNRADTVCLLNVQARAAYLLRGCRRTSVTLSYSFIMKLISLSMSSFS